MLQLYIKAACINQFATQIHCKDIVHNFQTVELMDLWYVYANNKLYTMGYLVRQDFHAPSCGFLLSLVSLLYWHDIRVNFSPRNLCLGFYYGQFIIIVCESVGMV